MKKSQSDSESDTLQSSSATSSRTFRIPLHSENTLTLLNKQRDQGEYCDVTILVEHQRYSAHKCILAANSPYLQSLISASNDGVLLRQITAESFRLILDFMYTSRLQLEPTTVQDVLNAAKVLQIRSVVSICCRYLESQIVNIAKDCTSDKPKRHRNPKPTAISVNTNKYMSPHNVGPLIANSTLIQPPNGQSPYYNQNMSYPPLQQQPNYHPGQNPNFLPQDYNRIPQGKRMPPNGQRFNDQYQPDQYRNYYDRGPVYNQKPATDQPSMYIPRNNPAGRTSRNDFYRQQPWNNSHGNRNIQPNPVSAGIKSLPAPTISRRQNKKDPRLFTADDALNNRNYISHDLNLPRLNSGKSHFSVQPEDRYFTRKLPFSKKESDSSSVEFDDIIHSNNPPMLEDQFRNICD